MEAMDLAWFGSEIQPAVDGGETNTELFSEPLLRDSVFEAVGFKLPSNVY